MVDSGDESRKKRELSGEETNEALAPENHKKFRHGHTHATTREKTKPEGKEEPVVDIETAMHRLLTNEKERLSADTTVSFRAGHAGDAPAMEALYRKESQREEQPESLELWLSEAMGDEGMPPCVFSIVAKVGDTLSAVALFSLAWQTSNQRILRVEWCHVEPTLRDAPLITRRMWLHLSALALMTGASLCVTDDCQLGVGDGQDGETQVRVDKRKVDNKTRTTSSKK